MTPMTSHHTSPSWRKKLTPLATSDFYHYPLYNSLPLNFSSFEYTPLTSHVPLNMPLTPPTYPFSTNQGLGLFSGARVSPLPLEPVKLNHIERQLDTLKDELRDLHDDMNDIKFAVRQGNQSAINEESNRQDYGSRSTPETQLRVISPKLGQNLARKTPLEGDRSEEGQAEPPPSEMTVLLTPDQVKAYKVIEAQQLNRHLHDLQDEVRALHDDVTALSTTRSVRDGRRTRSDWSLAGGESQTPIDFLNARTQSPIPESNLIRSDVEKQGFTLNPQDANPERTSPQDTNPQRTSPTRVGPHQTIPQLARPRRTTHLSCDPLPTPRKLETGPHKRKLGPTSIKSTAPPEVTKSRNRHAPVHTTHESHDPLPRKSNLFDSLQFENIDDTDYDASVSEHSTNERPKNSIKNSSPKGSLKNKHSKDHISAQPTNIESSEAAPKKIPKTKANAATTSNLSPTTVTDNSDATSTIHTKQKTDINKPKERKPKESYKNPSVENNLGINDSIVYGNQTYLLNENLEDLKNDKLFSDEAKMKADGENTKMDQHEVLRKEEKRNDPKFSSLIAQPGSVRETTNNQKKKHTRGNRIKESPDVEQRRVPTPLYRAREPGHPQQISLIKQKVKDENTGYYGQDPSVSQTGKKREFQRSNLLIGEDEISDSDHGPTEVDADKDNMSHQTNDLQEKVKSLKTEIAALRAQKNAESSEPSPDTGRDQENHARRLERQLGDLYGQLRTLKGDVSKLKTEKQKKVAITEPHNKDLLANKKDTQPTPTNQSRPQTRQNKETNSQKKRESIKPGPASNSSHRPHKEKSMSPPRGRSSEDDDGSFTAVNGIRITKPYAILGDPDESGIKSQRITSPHTVLPDQSLPWPEATRIRVSS